MGLMAGMLPGVEFAMRRRLRPAAEATCGGARRPSSLGMFGHDHAHLGSAGFAKQRSGVCEEAWSRGRCSWTASPGRPRRGWIRSSGARENQWSRGYPSKILEHMNVKGLKRHHVASHLQKYRAKLQMKNDMCNTSNRCPRSGDRPPQATHIVQTAHQPQSSSVARASNICATPFAGGSDAPVPASWSSSSQQQTVEDIFTDLAPMDVLTEGLPSSSSNPNTFPQSFFGPFSYQGPSLQAPDMPPAADHVTAASHCRTGSLIPESFDAEIEAFLFGSTGPTIEASENGAAAGTFVPPDQTHAMASAEEQMATVAEMMAMPSDVDLAMASYGSTDLNTTDEQFMFPLEALRGLDLPMDFDDRVATDGAMRWLNGEGDVQDYGLTRMASMTTLVRKRNSLVH